MDSYQWTKSKTVKVPFATKVRILHGEIDQVFAESNKKMALKMLIKIKSINFIIFSSYYYIYSYSPNNSNECIIQ